MTPLDPKKINVYLACPYYHPDPSMRDVRAIAATRYMVHLVARGMTVFSPLTHSRAARRDIESPQPHEFWLAIDLPILRICQNLHILSKRGWSYSRGIRQEVQLALDLEIPIWLIYPETYHVLGPVLHMSDLSSPDPDTQSTTKESKS